MRVWIALATLAALGLSNVPSVSAATTATILPCQLPGPDGYGYRCMGIPYSFLDIGGNGTQAHARCDDCSASVPLGFNFTFYGVSYSSVNFSSNGFLSFASTDDGCCDGQRFPDAYSPNAVIAGLWTDQDNVHEGGSYLYKTLGEAPNRTFIAEWQDIPLYPGTLVAHNTYEIVLFEGSGNIEVRIQDAYSNAPDFAVGSTGIEDLGGSAGVYARYGDYYVSHVAWRFAAPLVQRALPDLAITDVEGSSEVQQGAGFESGVTIKNFGPGPAASPSLQVRFPAGVVLSLEDVSADGDCALATLVLTCHLAPLGAGNTTGVSFGALAPSVGTSFRTVYAVRADGDYAGVNNVVPATIRLDPVIPDLVADLGLPKGGAAFTSDSFDVDVGMENQGGADVLNATLQLQLPRGLAPDGVPEGCALLALRLTCLAGEPIGPGSSVSWSLSFPTTSTPGTFAFALRATSPSADANVSNNRATGSVRVLAAYSDLSLDMEQSDASALPLGSNATASFEVSNGGPSDAINATLTVTLPVGVTVDPASFADDQSEIDSSCRLASRAIVCTVPDLPSEGDIVLRMNLTATGAQRFVTLPGVVTSQVPDLDLSDNSDHAVFAVKPPLED